MTAALAGHHHNSVVDTVTVDMRDDGTNRRARLAQRYAAAYDDPQTAQALVELTS